MSPPGAASGLPAGARTTLGLLGFLALALGLFARFKGLGTWPLTVDEYYLSRSIQNVLQSGWPAFPCGGLYLRGLLLQYVGALLQMAGLSAELSTRSIAAVSSIVTLPAVYLLGRRLQGPLFGGLAVALLALSLWEVEVARFGRMYAPFQAVFLWYLVFFLQHVLEGRSRALWGMFGLTIIGILTWEGGVLLALTNLMVPFLRSGPLRLDKRDWTYLAAAAALFVALYVLTHTDFRTSSSPEEDPGDIPDEQALGQAAGARWWPWALLGLPALGASLLACRWLWALRARWLTAAGLGAALAAGAAHQFGAALLVILLLMLSRHLSWRELLAPPARPFLAALVLTIAAWAAYAMLQPAWLADSPTPWHGGGHWLRVLYAFVKFPDVATEVIWPWARAVPLLGASLALGIAALGWRTLAQAQDENPAGRTLLFLVVCMVALTGASAPPRHETRYLFFLYPVLLLLALTAIAWLAGILARTQGARAWLTVGLGCAVFALTEDFSIRHLLSIDREATNFRVGVPRALAGHWVSRADVRGAADWLDRHVQPRRDLIVNAVPSVDFYYKDFDFTYVDEDNQRFKAYACERGGIERWGNLPLLSNLATLQERIAAHARTFVVLYSRQVPEFSGALAAHAPRIDWKSVDGDLYIVSFSGRPTGGH
jgi:hypothetical protein